MPPQTIPAQLVGPGEDVGVLVVPEAFAAATRQREGGAGARWVERLPALVGRLLHRWGLGVDGPVLHGYVAVVVPVRAGEGQLGALKVSWVDEQTRQEARALEWWAGRSAVTVLEAAPEDGAMLLGRLDAHRSLEAVDEDVAVTTAAALLRQLHVPAPDGLTSTAQAARRWQVQLPQRWRATPHQARAGLLGQVVDTCADLSTPVGPAVLVHGDFHYANVLAEVDGVGWAAIDPKPVVGDGEFDLLPLLRNRWADLVRTGDPQRACRRRLEHLVDLSGLDADRARAWALVRTVDDALWGAEHDQPAFTSTAWTIADALR